MDDGASQQEAPGEASEPEASPIFTGPLSTVSLQVAKSKKLTVHLGLPYALNVDGGIAKAVSDAKEVASVSTDGTLTLKKKGTAKITITRNKGKKLTLTLKVMASPAPKDLAIAADAHGFALKWSDAKYATGYLIEYSPTASTGALTTVSAERRSPPM